MEAAAGGPDIKVEVPVIDAHTGVYAKWSQPAPADRLVISRGYDVWRIYPPTWKRTDRITIGGFTGSNREVIIPAGFIANKVYTGSMNLFDDGTHYLDDVAIALINNPIAQSSFRDMHIFGYYLYNVNYSDGYGFIGRIYEAKITQANELINHFVPALDHNNRPCMFDTVSKKPFYNTATTGPDFLYG